MACPLSIFLPEKVVSSCSLHLLMLVFQNSLAQLCYSVGVVEPLQKRNMFYLLFWFFQKPRMSARLTAVTEILAAEQALKEIVLLCR